MPSSQELELLSAARCGDLAKVRELLGAGVNPNCRDEYGEQTPITVAATGGHYDVFEVLCDAGVELSARNRGGRNIVLFTAGYCRHGDEAVARRMFERVASRKEMPQDQEVLDSLLIMCCEERSGEHIRLLIQHGANAKHVDPEWKESALMIAVWHNRPDAVAALLEAGADANVSIPKSTEFHWTEDVPRKLRKKTVVELALGMKYTKVAQLLIEAGATYSESLQSPDSISTSWKGIEKWLKQQALDCKPLAKGATVKQLESAATELAMKLPDAMHELYRKHNGATDIIPGDGVTWSLLPLANVVSEYRMLCKLLDGGEFSRQDADCSPGVQSVWWHKGWIPFASNGGGDLYCVDLAPAEGGVIGQVIAFQHESGNRRLMASSLEAWLEQLATELQSGSWTYIDGEGVTEEA